MSTRPSDGGPAFPHLLKIQDGAGEVVQRLAWFPGMTLRDWFAGQALVGAIMAWPNDGAEFHAEEAYKRADAMLKERDR